MSNIELAIPHLRILDYQKAVDFYVGSLGFKIDFEWRHEPGFPVYMGIYLGTLCVHLSEHEGSGPPGQGRGLTLSVKSADSWFETLRQKGIKFEQEIQTQPWGSREFSMLDPFGNTIVVTSSPSE